MTNSKITYIIGWIFLISALFNNYLANIIASSIFFSAHFIIENKNKKN